MQRRCTWIVQVALLLIPGWLLAQKELSETCHRRSIELMDGSAHDMQQSWKEGKTTQIPKKKLLVLSSRGGYGHSAAVATLEKILGCEYQIHVVHPIDEMLRSSGVNLGEKIYDIMLKKRWVRSLNFLAGNLAPHFFKAKYPKIEKLVGDYIEQYQPDLVVSVIPFINYPASEAARLEDVPYLLITTDNDLHNWAYGLDKIRHPHFLVTIGSDLPTTRTLLVKHKISPAAIQTIGLPLRLEFLEQAFSKTDLKCKYQIPEGKPTVLVMMGGSGGQQAYDFAASMGSKNLGTHLIVCTGKHEGLKKALGRLSLHESNSMTVMGFTDKVAELMAVADVLITRAGPGTINEAIAMHLPVLVDDTETLLFWEKANMDMVKRFGIGQKIDNLDTIDQMVAEYLKNPEVRQKVGQSFASLPKNCFHEKISSIIEGMIEENKRMMISSCMTYDFPLQAAL